MSFNLELAAVEMVIDYPDTLAWFHTVVASLANCETSQRCHSSWQPVETHDADAYDLESDSRKFPDMSLLKARHMYATGNLVSSHLIEPNELHFSVS